MKHTLWLAGAAIVALMPQTAMAQARPSGTQKTQQQMMNDVPHCARKLGTLSIVDGDDPSGWTQYSLAPPQKLLKVLVQRSGCFNLVDRGSGLQAAELERNVGGNLGLQRGSNVGQGQIKAADYVLVAEVQAAACPRQREMIARADFQGSAEGVGALFDLLHVVALRAERNQRVAEVVLHHRPFDRRLVSRVFLQRKAVGGFRVVQPFATGFALGQGVKR